MLIGLRAMWLIPAGKERLTSASNKVSSWGKENAGRADVRCSRAEAMVAGEIFPFVHVIVVFLQI